MSNRAQHTIDNEKFSSKKESKEEIEDNLFQNYEANSKLILESLAQEVAGQNQTKNPGKCKNSTTRLSQSDLMF